MLRKLSARSNQSTGPDRRTSAVGTLRPARRIACNADREQPDRLSHVSASPSVRKRTSDFRAPPRPVESLDPASPALGTGRRHGSAGASVMPSKVQTRASLSRTRTSSVASSQHHRQSVFLKIRAAFPGISRMNHKKAPPARSKIRRLTCAGMQSVREYSSARRKSRHGHRRLGARRMPTMGPCRPTPITTSAAISARSTGVPSTILLAKEDNLSTGAGVVKRISS